MLTNAKSIRFNTEMVRAILDGKKTVTRRVIKPHYRDDEAGFQVVTTCTGELVRVEKINENGSGIFSDGSTRYVNPPYQVGDILYVSETWGNWSYDNPDSNAVYYQYRADYPNGNRTYMFDETHECDLPKWHPPIDMPKEAARIFLRVTDAYVERLHDITLEKAIKEGFENVEDFGKTIFSIYPQADGDTWVWVIEFEKMEGLENE